MHKQPGQWKLWQMVFLKKFLKRNMRPKTASQVNRYKLLASIGYFCCTMYFIHRIALRARPEYSGPGSGKYKYIYICWAEQSIQPWFNCIILKSAVFRV